MSDTIITRAHARAGLVGNPSDGYFGKTISFIIRDYAVTLTLTPGDTFEILPSPADVAKYDGVGAFLRETKLMGYYGATRLIKAAVVRFHKFWADQDKPLDESRGFTISFDTNVPRLVGMSGSSAIVVATLRALEKFYGVVVPTERMPTLALEVETKELDIAAGLQDRVIQTYEGMMYMDFDRALVERTGGGRYEPIRPRDDPPIYVAFDAGRAEVSGIAHRSLRAAWEAGERDVVNAMAELRDLTDRGKAALEAGDWGELHAVTNANFDVRRRIMPIAPENLRMVETARSTGASAKFAGSGGTIVGVHRDDAGYARLAEELGKIGCTTFKPAIFA